MLLLYPPASTPFSAGPVYLVVTGYTDVIHTTSIGALPTWGLAAGDLPFIDSHLRHYLSTSLAPKARWRASKGSAPVNRFTRAFGDNNTEGWHRTMPVATVTVVMVPVPVVFLRALAVAPTASAGTATVAAPATTIKLVAVAPAVSVATQVAVPSSRLTLNAVPPVTTTTATVAVPAVAVRDIAIAPTVVPGTLAITPTPVVLRLLAVAPQVQNFILVPAASLRLGAIAPSVTGGGGGGGGTVTLRKSGD